MGYAALCEVLYCSLLSLTGGVGWDESGFGCCVLYMGT